MPRPVVNADECSGCGTCVDSCPNGVLELVNDIAKAVNEDDCSACGSCAEECPMEAIEVDED
ncbi:MAG TPA: 4Fe-4S binding protein [Candidatus Aquicultor sp.]